MTSHAQPADTAASHHLITADPRETAALPDRHTLDSGTESSTRSPADGTGQIDEPKLRLRWSDVGIFVAAYVALTGVWFLIGKAIVASDALVDFDERAAVWFVDTRTDSLDTWATIASGLADTLIKIIATALIALGAYLIWRRRDEPLTIVLPLVLEAWAFITITYLTKRPRPDVDRLQESPVNSSFPSGHVAAAFAYSAIVVVVFQRTRNVVIRTISVLLGLGVGLAVAWGRLYQGMHHVTDVIAGAILGIVSVAICAWMVHRMRQRTNAEELHGAVVRQDV